ncbi:MAG: pyridoxamine 5'-phosphate oxidase family protein [Atribacterota bacterium]|nr:pyridoxamine 5'-phosphate oxidase family protein [Atribacterota bacterium]MDD3640252.1 pyridoxamine 5'-phosphate oxidase family protein [Atribacterota bacterium]MDI9597230.1 pyridoxamine 5'-phosphate oxidase family protein [Atribacterota bacterium]
MRRKDKEIKDIIEILEIVKQAKYCNVAMCRNNLPYIVPMNFGFSDETIYLHSANVGLKIDILKSNPQVCIGIVQNEKIKKMPDICDTEMKYSSVTIFGKAEFLSDEKEKRNALKCIVEHYEHNTAQSNEIEMNVDMGVLNRLSVVKVQIEKITGKRSV